MAGLKNSWLAQGQLEHHFGLLVAVAHFVLL